MIPPRQLGPDVGRGLGLALIAVANTMLYLHPGPYTLRQRLVEQESVDQVVAFLTVTTIDARIYPLFGLMLGYGMALQLARGPLVSAARRVRRRGLGLLVIGLLHGVLLFSGDILGLYGILMLGLIPALRWSDRRLLIGAAVLVIPLAAVQGLALSDAGPTLQRSILWSIGIADPLEAFAWRGLEWLMGIVGMLGVVPAVLVGVWAGRRDLLAAPDAHLRLLSLVGIVGTAVGLLGGLPAASLITGPLPVDPPGIAVAASMLHVATGIVGGVGLAALVGCLCAFAPFSRSAAAAVLAAVGQRSLTCYLLQSVLMVPLLPAWGLGLGAVFRSSEAVLFAIAIYAVTVAIAVLLREHGDKRPAESLLRRFADRRRPRARAAL